MTELPEPTRERWQPLRAGLVDLFYYDNEEFRFHDGRLLLRGNNGTGKSKVMALTLPFLLDGRLSPARVEPDGDSGKRMDWNLLLGEGGERQGYSWLEFGRLGEEGPEYRTIGCGLKAVQGRDTRSWFFVTPQRVGESLFLVESGRTLGRERLNQALEGHGVLYDQAGAYRRAIDEALFGLGSERYEALLDLLLQLRQPQLAKRPDESRLSRALTEALPPLDSSVVADVADAFRNLDAEREETEALEQAREAVAGFLGHYRAYAAIAGRRRARELRHANSAYETARGNLNRQEGELTEAREAWQALEAREQALDEARRTAEQERETLRDSPAMRSAQELENAEATARERRDYADKLSDWQRKTEGELERHRQRLGDQEARASAADEALQADITRLEEAASTAGIAADHRTCLERLGLPASQETAPATARDELLTLHQRREERVDLLARHNRSLAEAEQRLATARDQWQQHSDEQDRLSQAHQAAREAFEARADEHSQQWRDHLARLSELQVADTEAAITELSDWTGHQDGPNPARQALEAAREALTQTLAQECAREQGERERITEAMAALAEEQAQLERGEQIAPPAPHTRDEAQRRERPGAPLWQLLDFRDGVQAGERAGLEAALEAAGLLDAWVMPDGTLKERDTWDTLLEPDCQTSDTSLKTALVPATDWQNAEQPVPSLTVGCILGCIGYGPSENASAWVSTDGGWRLGPAGGAWGKDEAVYIGHAAREAARRARLEAIAAELADWQAELDAVDERLATLTARGERAEREWREQPDDRALRQAQADEAAALQQLNAQTERTEQARRTLDQRQNEADEQRRERDQLAADLDLPIDDDGLARVRSALSDYAGGVRELANHLAARNREAELLAQLRADTEAAAEEATNAAEAAREAEENARSAETRRDTLRASVGSAVEELQEQLAAVEARLEQTRTEEKQLRGERDELNQRIGNLEAAIASERERLSEAEERRTTAIERLRAFADEGLVSVATDAAVTLDEAPSWAAAPAVQLARQIEQALTDVDDSDTAWQRHQRGIHEHFSTLEQHLGRHGQSATAEQQDDLLIVRISFQNRRHAPDALVNELDGEIRQRRELLSARERELMENYLIDEVASHLQQRLMETEQRVARMNAELSDRPTSTGMRLRIRWQPLAEGEDAGGLSAPPELEATRERLLRQSMDAWSPADREAVGEFILARINEARQSDEGGDLRQLLERALDYRYWHRFRVERWQQGRWRPAYGPASGGERALVITLPLFAAAASHYGSASAEAPRLIMLDEVFAGVDDDARAKCMGLLAQFDLDVMMTSEREWGCYAEMPGLAICQLVRREGVDAVHVSRWRWDGVQRQREPAPDTPIEAEAAEDSEGPFNESLF
jgi:uncharacterized protein (TIGR02680 family)